MERALEESLSLFKDRETQSDEMEFIDVAIKSSIDAFMEAEEEKLILDQVKKETLLLCEAEENKRVEQNQLELIED